MAIYSILHFSEAVVVLSINAGLAFNVGIWLNLLQGVPVSSSTI